MRSGHATGAQALAQHEKTWLFYQLGLPCYQRSHQTHAFVQIVLLCK